MKRLSRKRRLLRVLFLLMVMVAFTARLFAGGGQWLKQIDRIKPLISTENDVEKSCSVRHPIVTLIRVIMKPKRAFLP